MNRIVSTFVRRTCVLAAIPLLAAAPAPAAPPDLAEAQLARQASEVLRWNLVALDTATALEVDPLTESRVFAMTQLAVHDTLNAIDPRYEQYGRRFRVRVAVEKDLAVATAAHRVLVVQFPRAAAELTAALRETIARTPEGPAKNAAIELGNAVAERILDGRSSDGSDRPVDYVPGTEPGRYRPTPPDFTPAAFAHWGNVRPFVLRDAAQFRPEPPPVPGSTRAVEEIAEVRALGEGDSAAGPVARTPEQSEIAQFWYENSTRGWNRIARAVVLEHGADEWDAARLFALVHLALADGFIGGFEAKYHYAFWRPATAIRDGGDADWLSFLPTPPVPDHPSTHTVLGAAAAVVLARVTGADAIPFSMTSGVPYPDITRGFGSFSEAARENGMSRVYAGIHFRSAVDAGLVQGRQIGAYVVENALRPLRGR